MFNRHYFTAIIMALATCLAMPGLAADLTLVPRVQVSTNNANFDISVFPGAAGYNDRGVGGTEPGTPTFTNVFGDGTVLAYNFVGNDGTGSALTTYASGGDLIPTPTSPVANVHGPGEEWANVWTVTDPAGFTTTKDHNPTNVVGAANTFARSAEVDGTIDISTLSEGQIYVMHGTFTDDWTITVTMSGPDQTDVVASETQGGNGPGTNFGWVTEFTFSDAGLYDTISYNYTNADRDGSRARFMGVILDGPEDLDGDGLGDLWEDEFYGDNSGTVEPSDLTASDGTGDPDGDGATDLQEYGAGSDPGNPDTDGDNLTDGQEINTTGTDPTLVDTDGDTLNDDVEAAGPTDPTLADTDGDGLDDATETSGPTDPTNPDTDGDGYNDGFEVANAASGFDPLVDDSTEDPDGDGLDNAAELTTGTNPTVADTDGDGDTDGEEVGGLVNPYTDGELGATPGDATDPLVPDSDGDGVIDGDETDSANGSITDPNNTDTDGDGFNDAAEISLGFDPTDAGDFPTIVPPDASLTWDAAQDTGGDNFWPTVEFPANTVMQWNFGGPVSPTLGVVNFGGVTAWYDSPSANMESFNDSDFNTNFSQPTDKPVTFELVFRPGDFTGNHLLFETGGNGDGLGIVINGDTLFFRAQDANSDTQRIILSHTFTAGDEGNFHHIVGTIQPGAGGTNMGVLYVNGTQVDSGGATGVLNDWAGGDNSGLGRLDGSTPTGQADFVAFTGDIARFRFWANTILTADEVGAIYGVISAPPADDDTDGLPDPWEILFFGDTTTQDGTDDGDSDGLNNLGEFDNETNPTVADTDGDSTNDGDEVNGLANPYSGGVLDAPPGDPTDPTDPDSDGDGVTDADETDNSNGSVSDPNDPDTDGDLYPDGLEISESTDPTDPGSKPNLTLVSSLGTGTVALLGGDITDPENDGSELAGPTDPSWNWTSITSTDKPGFEGAEASYNIFDNQVGAAGAKWCCNTPDADGHQVTVTFAAAYNLTHFTVTSGNDTPGRDPVAWSIQGSNDGLTWTDIYPVPGSADDPSGGVPGASLWSARNEVLRFDLPDPSASYSQFRYNVTGVAGGAGFTHQLNELELFGTVDDTDTDGGGLPDWFENLYGLNINDPGDDTGDADGDGLDAGQEFTAGTDPTDADTDGDGLTDGQEVNGTTGFVTNPLQSDTDGDGFSDGDEIALGSDPTNGTSAPGFNPITFQKPVDISGNLTDIDLTGTLVHAWNGGSATVTVDGIDFVPGLSLGTDQTGRDPIDRAGDADYETLLDSRTWNTSDQVLVIPGLTSGADYQIQIWTADTVSTIGELYGFTTDPDFIDPTQYADLEGGDDLKTFISQYVIGTFTANAPVQSISLYSSTNAGAMYSAIMVRQTSMPAPSLEVTNFTKTGANTFELTWIGGDGTNTIQSSTDGTIWTTLGTGEASPFTVTVDPAADPVQLFRVIEP